MSVTLEKAIHDELIANAALFLLLGSEDRIFYGNIAQGAQATPPYVNFIAVSRVSPETFDGDTGPLEVRYQFDCYATDLPKARDVARALRAVLQGRQGLMPDGGAEKIMVQSALCEGGNAGRDGYDESVRLYTCSVDFIVTTVDV